MRSLGSSSVPARRTVLAGLAGIVPSVVVAGSASPASARATVVPRARLSSSSAVPSVLDLGAVGDGRTDDTAALQAAFDRTAPGGRLTLPAGRTFLHRGVLRVRTAGLTLTGGGTLLAGVESASALQVTADDVVLDGIAVSVPSTTRRWGTWDQMAVCVLGARRFTARSLTVVGSAAAGVYLWGVKGFTLTGVRVSGTRADGIHVTGPSQDGTITDARVTGSGDDGIAVVSYLQDGVPVQRVSVVRPVVDGTTWGRGLSVVGGTDITVTDLTVSGSSAAALYLAQEGAPWFTFAPRRVRVTRGTIRGANHDASVDHGAVVVLAGRPGDGPADVAVSGLDIAGTRPTASRQVGLLGDRASVPSGVALTGLTVTGGPGRVLQSQFRPASWRVTGWRVTGAGAVPDHRGF